MQPKIGRLALSAGRGAHVSRPAHYTSARHQADRRDVGPGVLTITCCRTGTSLTDTIVPRRASEQVRCKRQQVDHRGERRGSAQGAAAPGSSERWRLQCPRSLLAHLFLGVCASHLVPRARLPLFRFRPPLPCPRAAATTCGGVAGLLAPTGKCRCPAPLRPLYLLLHGLLRVISFPLVVLRPWLFGAARSQGAPVDNLTGP